MLFHLIKESKKLKVASTKKDNAIKVIATAKSVSLFFMRLKVLHDDTAVKMYNSCSIR